MHTNEQLLTDFYTAFSKQNAGPMRAAYASNAHFTDPAFPDLRGESIGDMWTMLCERAKEFKLEFKDIKANDTTGSAHWEAWYLFQGNRKVHNIIEATFEFKDGKIVRHIDTFDFYRWSKQAIGPLGLILGWTPLLPKLVRGQAAKGLAIYQAKKRG
jgi:SnoaL-like domain